jgi:hypothetical protein
VTLVATDILLVATSHEAGTEHDFRDHPPAGDTPVGLGRGLSLEQLPSDKADDFMDACVPRGWDPAPARQFGQRYSFVRREAEAPDLPLFDPDQTILTAIALSRLIRPNPVGFEWAVRVVVDQDRQRLIPLDCASGFLAYVPDRTARNWLDEAEADELKQLLTCYWEDQVRFPERLEHAFWLCESAARHEFLDLAWPQTVTGLEALIHTDRHHSRRQFVARVAELSREAEVPGIDESFLNEAWESRSAGVHGSRVRFEDDVNSGRKFGLLQRVLQVTIRRAIEDADFRQLFSSSSTIRERWPLPAS